MKKLERRTQNAELRMKKAAFSSSQFCILHSAFCIQVL
jgi:hypothetical protein